MNDTIKMPNTPQISSADAAMGAAQTGAMAVCGAGPMMVHPFAPIYDDASRILILGSFPSVKSRESLFYYGNAYNRFWRVTAAVFGCAIPESRQEKTDMLLRNHAALWDVAASCEVSGSSDASITAATPNDIPALLGKAPIARIFANGRTAQKLYDRLILPQTGMAIIPLPSTSPANAAWSLERLIEAWRVIS